MTQWRMDVKEQRILSPDKIFTGSKASRRNLWSFHSVCKNFAGCKKSFALEIASRGQIFLQNKRNFASCEQALTQIILCLKDIWDWFVRHFGYSLFQALIHWGKSGRGTSGITLQGCQNVSIFGVELLACVSPLHSVFWSSWGPFTYCLKQLKFLWIWSPTLEIL